MQHEHHIRRFFHNEFPTYPLAVEELCQSLVYVQGKRLRDVVQSVLPTHRTFIDIHLSRVNTRSVKAGAPTFVDWLGSVLTSAPSEPFVTPPKQVEEPEEEIFDI